MDANTTANHQPPEGPSPVQVDQKNADVKTGQQSEKKKAEAAKRDAFFDNLQKQFSSFTESKSADSSPTGAVNKPGRQERPTTLPTKKSPDDDEDPGMMSEAETSATGYRRTKQRSILPVVRSPSKTLERPLGVVFLQYKNETKRAVLPNEITSMDTVRALFVRAWPKKLTMEFLEDPSHCIYIHDFHTKDVFFELDDIRYGDIKDRCLLRIHEKGTVENSRSPNILDDDINYFSEPEFDTQFQSQHVHKSSPLVKSQPYTVAAPVAQQAKHTHGSLAAGDPQLSAPPKPARAYGGTLPRTTPEGTLPPQVLKQSVAGSKGRDTSPVHHGLYDSAKLQQLRSPGSAGAMSPLNTPSSRSGSATPKVVDEEARVRVEQMERRLADLTGIVHSVLHKGSMSPSGTPSEAEVSREKSKSLPPGAKLDVSASVANKDLNNVKSAGQKTATKGKRPERPSSAKEKASKPKLPEKPAGLAKAVPISHKDLVEKTQKSVNRDIQTSPTKGLSSNKSTPSPHPPGVYAFSREQLRNLHLRTQELKLEVKTLRRMTQAQAMNIKESIREVSDKIKNMMSDLNVDASRHGDRERIAQQQHDYKADIDKLEKILRDLEASVEELRSDVINRRCRVNMNDVEAMAVALSHASRAVADLKVRFPVLEERLKVVMASEMETVVHEERFLKEEPDRLENALKRCKRLTGTLFTLKRLASVQEQRAGTSSQGSENRIEYRPPSRQEDNRCDTNLELAQKALRESQYMVNTEQRLDRAISSLYERTSDNSKSRAAASRPPEPNADSFGTVKRNTQALRKEPEPISKVLVTMDSGQKLLALNQGKEKLGEALGNDKRKNVPPPPPRRSRSLTSPLLSPTGMLSPIKEMSPISGPPGGFGAMLDPESPSEGIKSLLRQGRSQSEPEKTDYDPGRLHDMIKINAVGDDNAYSRQTNLSSGNSSSSESINSQDGTPSKESPTRQSRQELLALKHEELLRKQQQLQEQYSRLQKELQKSTPPAKVNGEPLKVKASSNEVNICETDIL